MVFLGAVAGFFVTCLVGIVVIIMTSDAPAVAADTTSPAGGGDYVGDAANGEELFNQTCAACHGQGGVGVDGLGPAMIDNEFVTSSSDSELIEFLEVGRPADAPDNESGITMPPKGGNPSLTEEDLADIASYLRTLN